MRKKVKIELYLYVECDSTEGAIEAAQKFMEATDDVIDNGFECEASVVDSYWKNIYENAVEDVTLNDQLTK